MKLRRLDADVQHFGDLFGGSPLSYKLQHLPFARRERRAAAPVTALGLGDDLDAARLEECPEGLAQHQVVICQHESHGTHSLILHFLGTSANRCDPGHLWSKPGGVGLPPQGTYDRPCRSTHTALTA